MADVDVVLYIDCTKMGAISQKEINLVGDLADRILQKNPTRFLSVFPTCFFLVLPGPTRLLLGSHSAFVGGL